MKHAVKPVTPAVPPPDPRLAARVAAAFVAAAAVAVASPAWAQFQALTSGTQSVATFTSGEIIVSLMIIGYCCSAIALIFNQRIGMFGFLVVSGAGAIAVASPDVAKSVVSLFRSATGGGGGTYAL